MKNTTALQAQCRLDTPLGPMTLAATATGLAGAWFDGQAHHPGELSAPLDPDHPQLALARHQLTAYFSGSGLAWPGFQLALDPQGTPFQQQVWQRLCAIAPGEACTYGDVARRLGRPLAVRAVGAAVGRNPISVVVPCHRVLGQGGALTGYAGGLDRKRFLLRHEGLL